jgi:hypothetical protein
MTGVADHACVATRFVGQACISFLLCGLSTSGLPLPGLVDDGIMAARMRSASSCSSLFACIVLFSMAIPTFRIAHASLRDWIFAKSYNRRESEEEKRKKEKEKKRSIGDLQPALLRYFPTGAVYFVIIFLAVRDLRLSRHDGR